MSARMPAQPAADLGLRLLDLGNPTKQPPFPTWPGHTRQRFLRVELAALLYFAFHRSSAVGTRVSPVLCRLLPLGFPTRLEAKENVDANEQELHSDGDQQETEDPRHGVNPRTGRGQGKSGPGRAENTAKAIN